MSFDFVSTFAKDFGDKLKIDKEKEKQNDLMDIDEVDSRLELTAQSVESKKTIKPMEKKKTIKSVEKKKTIKSVKKGVEVPLSRDINYEHSIDGMIVSGVNKGRRVEVRYVLPSNYEVEIGVNYDVTSSNRLEKGQIVNHCVVLAEIGVNKYLTHCKKILFLELLLKVQGLEASWDFKSKSLASHSTFPILKRGSTE